MRPCAFWHLRRARDRTAPPASLTRARRPAGPTRRPRAPNRTSTFFGDWTIATEATCTADGLKERVCACGEKETEPIPATGHVFDDWTVTIEATCTADGLKERTCACGEKESEVISSTGHGATEVRDAKAATCTAEGYTGDTYCTVCNEKIKSGAAVAETGHDYQNGICSACGEKAPKAPSEGLEFTLNDDAQSYCVSGIGTCTDTDIVIPSVHDGLPVTSIGGDAFSYCSSLTSIVIPDSVTSIGEYAFDETAYYNNSANWTDGVLYIGNHLIVAKTDISGAYTIREGTKHIADSAFSGCSNLTSIVIPDSVTSIGDYAFFGCSYLTSIVIPDSVTSIGDGAFSGCSNLTSIVIPDSVTSIGYRAFYDCRSLTSITFSGTKAQWIVIYMDSDWNYNTGAYTIHCTDGTISK